MVSIPTSSLSTARRARRGDTSPLRAFWSGAAGTVALLFVDGAAVALVALGAGAVMASSPAASDVVSLIAFAGAVQMGLKMALGLYPGAGLYPEARLRKAVIAWLASVTIAAVGHVLLAGTATGTAVFLLCYLGVLPLQAAGAIAVRATLTRLGAWGSPVTLAGDAAAVAALDRFLRANPAFGLRPIDGTEPARTLLWAARALPDPATLAELRRQHDDILLVYDLPRERLCGVHPAAHGWQIGLRLAPARGGRAEAALKRAFDLVLALPIALAAAPIVLIAAAAIRRVDPGPAFYVQTREGRNGSPIGVLKLRTMYLDADRMLAELLAKDPAAREEWETHFKLRNDPRILPVVGTFLRASSLDELPQLLNILRGEMSLVGPRPFPGYHLEAMSPAFRARRASVVPGLTGLWQISERSTADIAGQEQIDDFYISGRSFWVDLSIFLRTFAAVLGGRGAY